MITFIKSDVFDIQESTLTAEATIGKGQPQHAFPIQGFTPCFTFYGLVFPSHTYIYYIKIKNQIRRYISSQTLADIELQQSLRNFGQK